MSEDMATVIIAVCAIAAFVLLVWIAAKKEAEKQAERDAKEFAEIIHILSNPVGSPGWEERQRQKAQGAKR